MITNFHTLTPEQRRGLALMLAKAQARKASEELARAMSEGGDADAMMAKAKTAVTALLRAAQR